jgi:hypothetical protein
MEMLRNFYGEQISLNWEIKTSTEVRPGVVFLEYTFSGTTVHGKSTEQAGTAYIIVHGEKVQHVEMRNI